MLHTARPRPHPFGWLRRPSNPARLHSVNGFAVILLALVALGCQGFGVRSDWDATRTFGSEARIFLLEPPVVENVDPFADNSLLRKRVRAAVGGTLDERGFTLVEDREMADLLLTWHVMLEGELRIHGSSSTAGGRWGPRGYGGVVDTSANVRSIQESTLVIDMLDPESEALVWRGWGSGMLSTRDRVRSADRLEAGVQAILARFPPAPGESR